MHCSEIPCTCHFYGSRPYIEKLETLVDKLYDNTFRWTSTFIHVGRSRCNLVCGVVLYVVICVNLALSATALQL